MWHRFRRSSQLLLLLGILAAFLVWIRGRPETDSASVDTEVPVAEVERGALERTLRITGTTSAVRSATVTAPRMRGGVRMVNLLSLRDSGEMVRKGDVVAEIDSRLIQDRLDDAAATYEMSLSEIRKREAELVIDMENLKQDILVAESTYEKWKAEAKAAEIRTIVDRELLKIGVEESEAAYLQQRKELGFASAARDADLENKKISAAMRKLSLTRIERDVERCQIVSPVDGMAVRQLVYRNGEFAAVREGDTLRPGMIFLKVMDTSLMQIEAVVNQAESGLVRVGMNARVGLDAFPEVSLNGQVRSLGALAKGGGGRNDYVRTLPIQIRVEGTDERLIPDLSAFADLILETAEDALSVPRGAVFEEAGQHYVFVQNAEEFVRRSVTVGISNYLRTEVLTGLQEGERVALRMLP